MAITGREEPDRPPASVGSPRRAAELLPLAWDALKLAASADRPGVYWTAGVQIIAAGLAGVQVIATKFAVTAFLRVSSGQESVAGALPAVLLFIAVTLIAGTAVTAQSQRARVLAHELETAVWERVFEVTTRVSLETYESEAFYDDLERIRTTAVQRPLNLVQGLLGLIGGVVGTASLALGLAVITPLLLPLLLVGVIPIFLLQRRGGHEEFALALSLTPLTRLHFYLAELLTGRPAAKEVRAFGLAHLLRRRYRQVAAEYGTALRAHVKRRGRFILASVAVTAVLGTADLILLLELVSRGSVGISAASAAAVAVTLLASRLQLLARGASGLFEGSLFLSDLKKFLAQPVDTEYTSAVDPHFDGVRLQRVSFRYPQARRDALVDVDLEIRAGQVVALVGDNGSGKTTLAKVLSGLYRPTGGRLLGPDGTELSPDELRRKTTTLFQDFVRYDLTAQDNIGFGDPERADDREATLDAARLAGAEAALGELRHGFDTVLSARFGGQDLSVGQWQRVALARAVMRRASLVVLDEPTASLDPDGEAQLFGQIRAVLDGRSLLMVSHRFSTVRDADRIYVLAAGRVIESGTHDSLMEQDGRYAQLFRMQAAGYQERPTTKAGEVR